MLLQRIVLFWMLLVLAALATAAETSENTFEKRTWTPTDGAPSGAWKIAQTNDGLLWFASSSGLYRFDGEKFRRVETVYGSDIPSRSLGEVATLKRGLALVYQFGGVSIFTREGARHYGSKDGLPPGSLRSVIETDDGEVYVGTPEGVAKLSGKRWELQRNTGLPAGAVDKILIDQDGAIWVAIDGVLYVRPRGAPMFSPYMRGEEALAKWTEPEIILGKVLVISSDRQAVQVEFGKKPFVLFDKLSSAIDSVFEGPHASMFAWLGDRGGLVRLRQRDSGRYAIAESFEGGRPANSAVLASIVDREGNVWISTLNGVERLRAQHINDIAVPGTVFLPYIHKGLDDSMLMSGVASPQILQVAGAGRADALDLPNVAAMWRENAKSVWAASGDYLYHITHQGVDKWPLPGKLSKWQTVQSIVVDGDGIVWVSIIRHGLYRFSNGQWTRVDTGMVDKNSYPIIMYYGKSGKVWLGFTESRIAELRDGAVHLLPMSPSDGIGTVLSLIEIDGHLLAGGENGLMWVGMQGNHALLPEQLKVFRGVAGLGLDRHGALWLHGTDGIYHIVREELLKFWAQPDRRPQWEKLSLADGLRGNAPAVRPLPSLTVADNGRIYYATNSQVGWIDPANLQRNTRVPDVMILGLKTKDAKWLPKGPVELQAGTTALEIKYAVTALSVPEKVQIQYRLEGVDQEWQEPSGERVARYTNLAPGNYTFKVMAANEDGVWNNEGATLRFRILPQFWQTAWFHVLVFMLLLALLIGLHRWRVITIASRAAERTAARIEERERIARNLHDNLLQGVHALILRSGTILNRLPKGSQEELILEDALSQAEKLVEDTRDEMMELRSPHAAEQAFAKLHRELEMIEPVVNGRLKLAITGEIKRIRPDVARELCQVMKEAISNAARHSGASAIDARLAVSAHGVEAAVLDNGVGIPPEIAQRGIPGHWGITGMRERIKKLGGTMRIESSSNAGTALHFALTSASVFN